MLGNILQKMGHILRGGNSAQQEMKYLLEHGLKIGNNFQSYSPYAFDANWPWLISVGDDVMLSTNVKILAHDASTNYIGAHTKIGCVTIGNKVFIGTGSIILCNTHIGNNVVIGAGSVVSHDIPDNSVAAGNPARVIYTMDEFRKKHQQALKDHPYFNKYKWNEWRNASPEDWEEMRKALDGTYGYV